MSLNNQLKTMQEGSIKGVCKIQIMDEEGNLKREVVEENYVNPLFYNWYNKLIKNALKRRTYYTPTAGQANFLESSESMINTKALGTIPHYGIQLKYTDLAEHADDYEPRGDLIGFGSIDTAGSNANATLGSFNQTESVFSDGFTRLVFEFLSDAAIGTFNSIYSGLFYAGRQANYPDIFDLHLYENLPSELGYSDVFKQSGEGRLSEQSAGLGSAYSSESGYVYLTQYAYNADSGRTDRARRSLLYRCPLTNIKDATFNEEAVTSSTDENRQPYGSFQNITYALQGNGSIDDPQYELRTVQPIDGRLWFINTRITSEIVFMSMSEDTLDDIQEEFRLSNSTFEGIVGDLPSSNISYWASGIGYNPSNGTVILNAISQSKILELDVTSGSLVRALSYDMDDIRNLTGLSYKNTASKLNLSNIQFMNGSYTVGNVTMEEYGDNQLRPIAFNYFYDDVLFSGDDPDALFSYGEAYFKLKLDDTLSFITYLADVSRINFVDIDRRPKIALSSATNFFSRDALSTPVEKTAGETMKITYEFTVGDQA